ncbi:MAG: helix-turn-helix transcriptional regulator [Bacillota bacterium]|nr:helix-turn-helix transcriptional regulator [Bacillota bacterium]
MEKLDKEIGAKLKKIREDKGLTVRDVAEQIDVHFTYVSKIENGKVPSLEKLNKLCDLYGIKISSLFGKEIEPDDCLKSLGVDWISVREDIEENDYSPEQVKKALEILRLTKKL